MAIESADEFVRLRSSDIPMEYERAAMEAADESVWMEVIERYPDMRFWVAQNQTVPLTVLRVLATDHDLRVRSMVASKRKLDSGLFELLARDADEEIRAQVALNRRVPHELLVTLASDESEFVRDAANQRLRGE